MYLRFLLVLASLGIIVSFSHAQLSGYVTTDAGEALPYASVYVEGTSIGTTSNSDGFYSLNLEPGQYSITCEYLGYSTEIHKVQIQSEPVRLDFSLNPMLVNLPEMMITPDGEDPAYRIIREARKHRKQNLYADMPQKCDLYMKGRIGLFDAPDQLMGQDLTELENYFDSIGTRLFYLSETISTLYKTKDDIQEIIHSSRVSGNSGVSFNRGKFVEYSIYQRNIQSPFGKLINPIGPYAFAYYEFKLLSINSTDNGLNYKIQVIPKNSSEPTVFGTIYISEKDWKVSGFSFNSEGKRVQLEIIDTFHLQQEYIDVQGNKVLFKNSVDFQVKILGFKLRGLFLAVYTDYAFGQAALSDYDERLSVAFQDSAINNEDGYWSEVRPVKLTEEEIRDYEIKDSLTAQYNSEKDSMENVRNRYRFMNVLNGYAYNKDAQNIHFSHSGLLDNIGFDPVRGVSAGLKFSFSEIYNTRLKWDVNYGTIDQRWRYGGEITHSFDENHVNEISFSLGKKMKNINSTMPFSREVNEFMAIFFHRNYIRFYDGEYYKLNYKQRIVPGLNFRLFSTYNARTALHNNSSYSLFYKDRKYHDNIIEAADKAQFRLSNTAFTIGTEIDFYPGTKYSKLPEGKIVTFQERFSRFTFAYMVALPFLGADVRFHKLRISHQRFMNMGILGSGSLAISGEMLLGGKNLAYQDLLWIKDNGSFYIHADEVKQRFLGLDAYTYYSDDYALKFHYYHDFQGLILNKIPLLKKLGFTLSTRLSALYMPDRPFYTEIAVGVDRIGWKLIRPFRFDFVFPMKDMRFEKIRYVLGLRLAFSQLMEGQISF